LSCQFDAGSELGFAVGALEDSDEKLWLRSFFLLFERYRPAFNWVRYFCSATRALNQMKTLPLVLLEFSEFRLKESIASFFV
jgi:hypothetical protein